MARAGQDLQRSLECGKGGYGISGLGAGEMLRSEVGCWCFFFEGMGAGCCACVCVNGM